MSVRWVSAPPFQGEVNVAPVAVRGIRGASVHMLCWGQGDAGDVRKYSGTIGCEYALAEMPCAWDSAIFTSPDSLSLWARTTVWYVYLDREKTILVFAGNSGTYGRNSHRHSFQVIISPSSSVS